MTVFQRGRQNEVERETGMMFVRVTETEKGQKKKIL